MQLNQLDRQEWKCHNDFEIAAIFFYICTICNKSPLMNRWKYKYMCAVDNKLWRYLSYWFETEFIWTSEYFLFFSELMTLEHNRYQRFFSLIRKAKIVIHKGNLIILSCNLPVDSNKSNVHCYAVSWVLFGQQWKTNEWVIHF